MVDVKLAVLLIEIKLPETIAFEVVLPTNNAVDVKFARTLSAIITNCERV